MKFPSTSLRRLTIESLELRRVLAASLSCPAFISPPSSHAESVSELVAAPRLAAPQVSLPPAGAQMVVFGPPTMRAHKMAANDAPHAHMDDANSVSAMHMQHHHIPDFAAPATHVVRESGRWSDIASLRDVNQNSVVVIDQGFTVIFDRTDIHVKAVGVYGTLRFASNVNTSLRLQELLVYGSGYLEIGTKDEPIHSDVSATLSIGDRPLDLAKDPTQAGNGVIVLGKMRVHGHELRETFVNLTASPRAGDSVLYVSAVPAGWRVGDVISLPQTTANKKHELTEEFTVLALTENTISLDRAVGFDRPPAVDGDLQTVTQGFDGQELRGYVANLSRNVIFKSENPTGNRGHWMAIGAADLDIRYAAFEGLGRTKIGGDDPIVVDANGQVTHAGTNQIGRYSLHLHHLSGPRDGLAVDSQVDPAGLDARQYRIIGNAISDGEKWGITIHNTHYGLVADNVIHQVKGAGIITEEGSESFNYIAHNFSFGLAGTGSNSRYDTFGDRGSAFWARSGHNYWLNNTAAAAEEGFGLYISNDFGNSENANKIVRIPKFPGAGTMLPGDYFESQVRNLDLLRFDGNEAYAIKQFGFGSWDYVNHSSAVPAPTITNSTFWNSTGTIIYLDYNAAVIDGLIIRGQPGQPTGVAFRGHNPNGGGPVIVRNFDIQLMGQGLQEDSRPASRMIFENGYVRNFDGFYITSETQPIMARQYIFRNVKFDAVPGHDLVAIRTVLLPGWERGGNYSAAIEQTIEILVFAYQGDPDDNFRLYFNEQAADYVIPQQVVSNVSHDFRRAPEQYLTQGQAVSVRMSEYFILGKTPGQTNAQAWNEHRAVLLHEVAPATAVRRAGLIGLAAALPNGTDLPTRTLSPLPSFWFTVDSRIFSGSTAEIIYNDFQSTGAEAILFRIDGGAWVRETDNDGRIQFSGLSVGVHSIESALSGPSGKPWGTRVKSSFSVTSENAGSGNSSGGGGPQLPLAASFQLPASVHAVVGAESLITIDNVVANGARRLFDTIVGNSLLGSVRVNYAPGSSTATLRIVPVAAGNADIQVVLFVDGARYQQAIRVNVTQTADDPPVDPGTVVTPPPPDNKPTEPFGVPSFAIANSITIPLKSQRTLDLTEVVSGGGTRSIVQYITSSSAISVSGSERYVHGQDSAQLTVTARAVGSSQLHVILRNAGPDGAYHTPDDLVVKKIINVHVVASNDSTIS